MDAYQIARRRSFGRFVTPRDRGVEIGPSFRPTFPKAEGFQVTVVDHCPTDQLRAKYAADGNVPAALTAQIEAVDVVWTGGPYRDLAGMPRDVDYVVASHVIEHVVDVCGFLQDCSSLLRPGGVLLLAIPLRRCIMDCFRPASTLGDILLAHVQPWAYECKSRLDEVWSQALLGAGGAWAIDDLRAAARSGRMPEPMHPVEEAGRVWRESVAQAPGAGAAYRDAHRWVFDPETFEEIAWFLALYADTGLVPEPLPGGHDCEFHAVLRRHPVEATHVAALAALRQRTLVERLVPSVDLVEKPAPRHWLRRLGRRLRIV
jgi:hypothetical protein